MRALNPKTHMALVKLDAMIKQKGILAATLFRDRTYNTSVGAQGNVASHDERVDMLDWRAALAGQAALVGGGLAAWSWSRRRPPRARTHTRFAWSPHSWATD